MKSDHINLLDSGMGKTLSMKGVEIPSTIWSANALLVAPEIVVEVHKENIEAGANIITTNSYGVIRGELAKENIEHKCKELNQLAGFLAKKAISESESKTLIAGSLPPQNGSYRPDRVLNRELIEPLYREQVEALDVYVDLFICETMSTIEEAVTAASVAIESGKPVLVGLTLHDERAAHLRSGESIQAAIDSLIQLSVDGLLANCCLPERISDAMPIIASGGFKYRGGYANAFTHVPEGWLLDGSKENHGSLTLREDLTPDRYCDYAVNWIKKGANIVGGCCGTTAAHIRAISESLTRETSPG